MLSLIFFFLLHFSCTTELPYHGISIDIDSFLVDAFEERDILCARTKNEYSLLLDSLVLTEQYVIDDKLSFDKRFDALVQQRSLEKRINALKVDSDIELVCFRYRKGIEVLKMIYEKVLSLDHHFSGLRTYQNISMLSNPNSFPEFVKAKEYLKANSKSKNRVNLPSLLDNNPLFSMGYTLMYSFFGSENKSKKAEQIDNISCLLDFTLAMQTDLKIIFYETEYLRLQNLDLQKQCLSLFDNYVKVVKYNYGLEYCRDNDDWEQIFIFLDSYKDKLLESNEVDFLIVDKENLQRLDQLRFSIDLLMDFIESYSQFVYMGEMYYEKFLQIVKNYKNKDLCIDSLPEQYIDIENEIIYSIEKFDSAYDLVELRGSKLRELMYGMP